MKRKILCALLIASIASTHAFADSVTGMPAVTAFSYQGQLEAAGTLANGVYQFTFTLYTAANGGMPVGGTFPIHQQIIVVDGVFTTDLDFGRAFNGKQYWLEVKVGSASGAVETLSTRQAVNAVPIAQYALNSPAGVAGPPGAVGPSGPIGPIGLQGPMGDKGVTGPAGATGAIGPAGAIGATGPAGATGAIGPAGVIGATGAIGPAGATGAVGPGGVVGATGPAGSVGPVGATGAIGPAGAIGATGPVGATGPSGPAGNIGATGLTGPSGAQGPAGPAGIAGATGPQGLEGPQGGAGETGPEGSQGIAGAVGSAGPAGLAGLAWKGTWSAQTYGAKDAVEYDGSTYISLVDDNADNTPDADVLAAGGHWALLARSGDAGTAGAQGPAGAAGSQGPAGPAGQNGAPGSEGATGPAGAQGLAGPEGPAGSSGAQGVAGPAGSPGETGPAGPAGSNGAAGLAGKGIDWKGTWVGDPVPQVYAVGDAVAFNGSSYVSLVDDNAGNSPDTDVLLEGGHWALLARGGDAGNDGQAGATGAVGLAGLQGASGSTGAQGSAGPMGQEGTPGPEGAVGPMGPQGLTGDMGLVGPPGRGTSVLLNAVIPSGNGSGLDGFSYFVVPTDAVASEGDGIFVMPADCTFPKLRIVAQAGISASYTFTLLHYSGPQNSAGGGTAIVDCTVDSDTNYCSGWAEMTIAEDDGLSIRMDGNAVSATTSAIAVSLSCR